MKMYKLFPILALLLAFGSCQDREREVADEDDLMVEETDNWNVDEAMANWRDDWNQNDAQKLEAATADDAVLLLNGKAHRQDSVSAWIENSSSWMKDLRTTSVMKNKAGNLAYEAGTYSHTYKENDTMQAAGTYTVIWERSGDQGDWAIKLMDISPQTEMDTIAGQDPQM